ncbi:MAG: hypothetical protein J6N19_02180 [Clostridium sp.]|nr:hypothetical protein [Clostridium sp.]
MAILLEVRPDAPEREQIRSLREQLEVYLNGLESITPEEIDRLIANLYSGYARSGSGASPWSGGGGVSTYLGLSDKPRIEGVILQGDKSFEDLQLQRITNAEIEELLSNADATEGE